MWNPFKAIGNAITGAGKAIGNAVAHVASATFRGREKAPTPAPKPPAVVQTPKTPTPVRTPTPRPTPGTPKLPPSTVGPITGGHSRDERVLGADSDQERALVEAVKEFEADFGTGNLRKDALNFIDQPSLSAIFDKYAGPSGFSSDQWLAGMQTTPNIRIKPTGDGGIDISFEADYEIDGYDLGGRTVSAGF